VEFTCVVGKHNVGHIDELIRIVEDFGEAIIIFQPALNSLFQGADHDSTEWVADAESTRAAFRRVEWHKRRTKVVGNGWASLRHFRVFPEEKPVPCAAGWVMATLDPEGVLFYCDQVSRSDRSNNTVALGVKTAFERLPRENCGQCWCARLVEGNYAWGCRVNYMLPPLRRDD